MTVATISLGIHMIGEYDHGRTILHRVVHVGAGQRTTNATEARKRGLARGLSITIRHRDGLVLGYSLNELKVGTINYCIAKRPHTRTIANEHEAHAGRAELFSKQFTASAGNRDGGNCRG